ncbi:DUF4810 domain-containing protein [Vibrio parahaemolyticus]|nr:DUF4810 domain-containing protein [Vibrio parahaemolyticus]EHU5158068.1 DUF4810 domain-containing protein [Vibrio parahaemolyticus]EII2401255.1 DUF4810 domain-containing protein [Vibrio parahaemolyticus]ELA7881377.1 DUF4810 domain-containing protein [Vibrio parahaemolyticus]ELA9413545.1 DUF4810 domain-containing protein [Vibrio parahaemolyticus]
MKFLKTITAISASILLFGCQTTNTLYDWGGYDEGLYEYYYDPIEAKEFPIVLETHLVELEERGQKPAPGLYAEVGTFNLKSGNTSKAIAFYKKEAETWPESAPLMSALIQNLERLDNEKEAQN